ncbi:MAG: biotin--[acetyl-CoA-carboxylase] ligase [Defluviitaleaceae bacterium]|nr:biotin--[acetyl-CoA-carboxylase] ligase [Defluviitaleaceae bacterium]
MNAENIQRHLKNNSFDINKTFIEFFDEMDSTHTKAKTLINNKENIVIISNSQTNGYGRYGKSFHSPKGRGIYMSFVLNYFNVSIDYITMYVALVVCEAIYKSTGIQPSVKWVNDIFINNYKIAGILVDNFIIGDFNVYVIGIGINFYNEEESIPKELKNVARAIFMDTIPTTTRSELVANIIQFIYEKQHYRNEYILDEYKKLLFILNRIVYLVRDNIFTKVKVLDLDKNGYLIVEDENGTIQKLIAGEVSIRIEEGLK